MKSATIQVPPELEDTWPCRRIVLEKIASITEVETLLSIDDVDLWYRSISCWHDARPQTPDE